MFHLGYSIEYPPLRTIPFVTGSRVGLHWGRRCRNNVLLMEKVGYFAAFWLGSYRSVGGPSNTNHDKLHLDQPHFLKDLILARPSDNTSS